MTAFGIDFGTTNSVLAAVTNGRAETVSLDDPPDGWGTLGFDKVLPTVLAEQNGGIVHGWRAKGLTGRLDAVKRLFTSDDDVRIGNQTFKVEEAAGIFFREIKRRAALAGLEMDQAVVTIPANSRGKARSRTKISAGLSGIEVLALLNEPTAAAMAYSRHIDDDQRVLVFDFGGGTLDVTVLRSVNGVFVEEASKGIQRLGGIDVDEAFSAGLRARVPVGSMITALDIERAKILLSTQEETTVSLLNGGTLNVTRGEFEAAIRPLILKVREPIDRCMADLGNPIIDHLVLVGGSSKIPAVRNFVREVVRMDPMEGVDPMTAIAEGAAIAAGILKDEITDFDFFVGIEHALGTIVHNENESPSFSVLIGRNTMLPAEHTDTFIPGMDDQESVLIRVIEGDPDAPVDSDENVILETWDLKLLEKRKREDATIAMRYRYDVDGILHVTVADVKTGTVMLDEEVRQGAAKDRRSLVEMRKRVESTVTGGPTSGSPTAPAGQGSSLDAESSALIDKASAKIVPFVEDDDASELQGLISTLRAAAPDDRAAARAALDTAVRKHAYLL